MRLKSLKLSGFKSFIDSTKFTFTTNLSGVVGPNGCGKSNTIDAVRWVMGERSAKHLRGDSMADVIFNGAKTRKPVGQASVELIFDNSDGRIQGQYAAYNEIAVKRAVNRDGLSEYFLNSTRCRRRDIMDLFLGTGLGPKSYAIIEQGMISRMVEAKPEDVRGMIEEAAGISKYKERRRDTENRIRHTKDNLSRITDLKEEIEKQIERLKRQVKAAEKYREFKKDERKLKAELLSYRWQEQAEKHKEWNTKIKSGEVELEAELTRLQEHNTTLEKINQDLIKAQDEQSTIQAEFYQVNSEINATEQTLKSSKERAEQTLEDLAALKQKLAKNLKTQKSDQATSSELSGWIDIKAPKLVELENTHKSADESRVKTENSLNEWQNLWNRLQQDVLKSEQKTGFAKAKIEQLEQQQAQLLKRKAGIEQNLELIPDSSNTDQTLAEKLAIAKNELNSLQEQKNKLLDKITNTQASQTEQNRIVDELKIELRKLTGRIESLKVLRDNKLDNNEDKLKTWLNANHLSNKKRIFETIKVSKSWENAVNNCLGDFVNALCLESDNDIIDSLAISENLNLSLITSRLGTKPDNQLTKTLNDVVDSEFDLSSILGNIYISDNLGKALELREKLENGQSIITRDGLWLGINWIRKISTQSEPNNLIKIDKELRNLNQKFSELETRLKTNTTELANTNSSIAEDEKKLQKFDQDISKIQTKLSDLQAEKSAEAARNEQIKARSEQLKNDLEEITNNLEQAEQEINGTRNNLKSDLGAMNKFADEISKMELQKDNIYSAFLQARQEAETAHGEYHNLAVEFKSRQSRLNELNSHISRISSQHAEEKNQETMLQQRIDDSKAPIEEMENKLKKLIDSQHEIDRRLTDSKTRVSNIEFNRQQHANSQRQIEEIIQNLRTGLENLRLQAQESNVRATALMEEMETKDIDPQIHLDIKPEDASIKLWQEKLAEVERKISRLGAINLAAIEEFKAESERKTYIDKQFADLTEALDTLEGAIGKIDKETKSRFKDTFDKTNSGIQKNFPTLFGGGKAYLELTDDDLLEAGVNIMAQPPGKRNSTIHLLSGGEKALTAVALIFAIFELNPAPFCMLDEVDAPLDDANVERFCQMVRKMSERIQFIIVTHNKITMEIADQLTGVTMQEAGVSRMVAVNLQQAAQMVD